MDDQTPKEKLALQEHLRWLSGRMPSEASRQWQRDFSEAPIYAFACRLRAERREKILAMRKRK